MNIAIAGYGIEGESNYKYWSRDKNNHITIFNETQPERELPVDTNVIIGDDAFRKMNGFDLVIRTAGLAPRKIITDGKIWSATNEFFAKCPAKIIGVTGSKGKGTTASIIASILEKAGKKVWLVGNIGLPGLDVIDQISADDIVVYELSSFQLWDLEKSPSTSVVLFIEQEHLDVHTDMNEYITAKSNITKNQSVNDLLIYNANNDYAKIIAETSVARKIGYTNDNSAHVMIDMFYYGDKPICPVSSLGIVGKFNYNNACAAIDAIWDITNDPKIIELGLSSFKGLPHRLQFIREIDGVKYYDDSIATIPGAAIAALNAFDTSKVIILGGSDKGADFSELGSELNRHDVRAILIGSEAGKIAKACELSGFHDFEIIDNFDMNVLIKRSQALSKPGGVVLLSPACASFGLFKNYADRGDQFSQAVNDFVLN